MMDRSRDFLKRQGDINREEQPANNTFDRDMLKKRNIYQFKSNTKLTLVFIYVKLTKNNISEV